MKSGTSAIARGRRCGAGEVCTHPAPTRSRNSGFVQVRTHPELSPQRVPAVCSHLGDTMLRRPRRSLSPSTSRAVAPPRPCRVVLHRVCSGVRMSHRACIIIVARAAVRLGRHHHTPSSPWVLPRNGSGTERAFFARDHLRFFGKNSAPIVAAGQHRSPQAVHAAAARPVRSAKGSIKDQSKDQMPRTK
jgi:hypothetical protein